MLRLVPKPKPTKPPDALPELTTELNRAALAREFQQTGRLNIQNILTPASATRVHSCLKDETPYDLCLNLQGQARALRNLTPQERNTCVSAAWQEVGLNSFQFLFDMHRLSLAGEAYPDESHYWAKFIAFLNGTEFLTFVRDVTGLAGVDYADAQATLYSSGNFLTAHDDDVPESKRVAAYVFGFTPSWRPEWGGMLEFLDANGEVEAGYLPGFNTLKLFRVPMSHYVSMVAPYAKGVRYSVTGWLRSR